MNRRFAPTPRWDAQVEAYLRQALGGDAALAHVSAALVRPSLRTSLRVNTASPLLLHRRIGDGATKMTPEQAALADAQALLPHHAVRLHPTVPAALVVEGRGPLAPDYDAVAGNNKEVVINRLAAEAVLKGADVFAPGLIAASPGIAPGDLVAVSAALELPGKRWCGLNRGALLTPAAAAALGRQQQQRDALFVGTARAALGRAGMFRAQGGLALAMHERVFDIPPLGGGLLRGKALLQALPSIVAAHVAAPAERGGARVLDMCASPGGKATMIAQLMMSRGGGGGGGGGEVVALDRTRAKADAVASMAADLGLSGVVTALVADSTQLWRKDRGGGGGGGGDVEGDDADASAANSQLLLAPGSFDAVLLDAPCSALGLRPRLLLDNWTLPQLRSLASYQRALLHSAAHMLRPGGTLTYCTCTINPLENESNVAYALDALPLRLIKQPLVLGGPGLAGDGGGGGCGVRGLTAAEASLVQRFEPGGEHDTIGFFIAKFVKL